MTAEDWEITFSLQVSGPEEQHGRMGEVSVRCRTE